MSRVGWWIRKEWREQRAPLLIAFGLGLIVTWLFVWEGRGVDPAPDAGPTAGAALERSPHNWKRDGDWSTAFTTAIWAAAGGVAAASFAVDRRRGVTTLMARSPGAWRAAFWGKLIYFGVAMGVVALLQGLWLGRLAAHYNLQENGTLVDVLWLGPVGEGNLTNVAVATCWATMLLLGSIAGPAQIPGAGGALLLVALVLPFAALDEREVGFYRWWLGSPRPLLYAGALAALVVTGVAWFRWTRAARGGAHSALLSAACMLVLGGGAFAGAIAKRAEFDDVQPGEAGTYLSVAAIGEGARFAFVTVRRTPGTPDFWFGPQSWNRGRLFALDLQTGRSHALGFGSYSSPPREHVYPWHVDTFHVNYLDMEAASPWSSWNQVSATSLQPLTDVVGEVERGTRRRHALALDAGHRAWLSPLGLSLEDAGGAVRSVPLDLVRHISQATAIRPISGGWLVRWGGQSGDSHASLAVSGPWASVDAADGKVRYLGVEGVTPRGYEAFAWLTPDRVLITPFGPESDPRQWRVLSVDARSSEPMLRTTHATTPSAMRPLAVMGAASVLGIDTTSEPFALSILDFESGRARRLAVPELPLRALRDHWAPEPHPTPTAVGGVVLVTMLLGEGSGDPSPGEARPGTDRRAAAPKGVLPLVIVVRSDEATAWTIRFNEPVLAPPELLGVDGGGAVWLAENSREIVRYGPAPGVRQVMFPRDP